jgi:hypothetical protein
MRFRDPQLTWPPYVEAVGINRRVLQERAVVLKFTCSPPQSHVQVGGEIGADLSFYSGKRRSGGPNEIFWDTVGTVEDVVRKLIGAIGRQEQPISRHIWTHKDGARRLAMVDQS